VFNSVIIAQSKLVENPDIKLGKMVVYVRIETVQPYLYYDKLVIISNILISYGKKARHS